MMTSAAVVILALVNAPQVEISTIEGMRHAGTLTSAGTESWTLNVDGKSVDVLLSSMLEARMETKDVSTAAPPHETVLIDGSRIGTSAVALAGQTLTITAPAADSIRLPRLAIGNIRLAESPSSVDDQWAALLERERREDWLVIRKQDKLDFVPGVISEITAEHVSLLLDGETVPVPRARVFGVIFHQRQSGNDESAGVIELAGGDRLAVQSVTGDDSEFEVHLAAGPTLRIPVVSVRAVDFSADKLTWLSSLKPRDIKHEFRFIGWAAPVRNDRDSWGGDAYLRLGNQTFSRGVCIRSKAVVQYRLNGDFRRFVALMGIQEDYQGAVHVEILADGQKLLDQAVSWRDEKPVNLDLDVSGKFLLEIRVGYGEDKDDIGDNLVLAEARLLK